jgi:hypothetical protein
MDDNNKTILMLSTLIANMILQAGYEWGADQMPAREQLIRLLAQLLGGRVTPSHMEIVSLFMNSGYYQNRFGVSIKINEKDIDLFLVAYDRNSDLRPSTPLGDGFVYAEPEHLEALLKAYPRLGDVSRGREITISVLKEEPSGQIKEVAVLNQGSIRKRSVWDAIGHTYYLAIRLR